MYIFDLDGTLLDSNGLWREVDREFLARRGLRPTEEYEAALSGAIFPTAAAFTKRYYGLDDTPEQIMAEWEALAAHHYRDLAPLKPGAARLLERLRERGERMALFTACRPALCRAALERFGLEGYFERLVFAETLGVEKHSPQCFSHLSQVLGVPARECTLLDDNPANCAAAKAAGMAVVGVYDPCHAARGAQMRALCDRYVMSLDEVLRDDCVSPADVIK